MYVSDGKGVIFMRCILGDKSTSILLLRIGISGLWSVWILNRVSLCKYMTCIFLHPQLTASILISIG